MIEVIRTFDNNLYIKSILYQKEDQDQSNNFLSVITYVCFSVSVLALHGLHWSPIFLTWKRWKNLFPKSVSNVIFFCEPIIASHVVDLVCLMLIIYQICRVRHQMWNIRRSSSYKDAAVYLRIVVLSGVFWITDILAVVFETEVFEYVFTIFCGLQGLLITFASLTTVSCFKRQIYRPVLCQVQKKELFKISYILFIVNLFTFNFRC